LGSIVLKEREPIQDIRGGILADEPGLGKTATILSLVMRTRGVISTPPDNCRVQWGVGVDQNDIGYYYKDADSKSSIDTGISLRSRSRCTTSSRSYSMATDVRPFQLSARR